MDQCLKLLQNASSDNEKMAALLMVAKLVKSEEIGLSGRKKVFKAVGFSFINRLLASESTEIGSVNTYHRIAVTLLACFCTDEDMLVHPQVTSKISFFNDFIQQKSDEASGLAEDSLQCLKAISGSSDGVHYLLKHQTLQALAGAYVAQNKVSEEAKNILLGLLGLVMEKGLGSYDSSVLDVITVLLEKFRSTQDQLKFDLCAVLCSVLRLCSHLLMADDRRLGCAREGLRDIFYSKLDQQKREAAIHLSATLCDLFGLDWAMEGKKENKFLNLWLHLIAVEVKLAIEEDCSLEGVAGKSAILCSCFVILESTIVALTKCEDEQQMDILDSETILQLHTVLCEAFTSIILLLNAVSSHERGKSHNSSSSSNISWTPASAHPIVAASIRVLGAWLAEETLMLTEGLYELLPFLLRFAGASSPRCVDEDLLKFLLPGLCHLSAEDKARKLLLGEGLVEVLGSYLQDLALLVAEEPESREVQGRFVLCCEIVQNICAASPRDWKKIEECISPCLTKVISKSGGKENSALVSARELLETIARRDK